MDEEDLQLEAELKRLRPRALAPAVETRVAASLARRRRVAVGWWVALPLAAALAVAVVPWRQAPQAEPAPMAEATTPDAVPAVATDEYKPVAAENLLYASRDEGVVTLADGGQARRLRRSYVDTITWRNPRTNASLKWSVPRDEVRVVPVNFQ